MTTGHDPTGVCVATRIVPARLIIRHTTPGCATQWPMLAISKCPWTPPYTAGHGHWHIVADPGPRWWRLAPCNRRPYVLAIAP